MWRSYRNKQRATHSSTGVICSPQEIKTTSSTSHQEGLKTGTRSSLAQNPSMELKEQRGCGRTVLPRAAPAWEKGRTHHNHRELPGQVPCAPLLCLHRDQASLLLSQTWHRAQTVHKALLHPARTSIKTPQDPDKCTRVPQQLWPARQK